MNTFATNPFATMGVEARFDLDLAAVEKTHRELSRALHPDRYVSAGASERREALTRAVEVNEAWRVLRDPIRRAEALLGLRGLTLSEGREPKAAPELLMEILELRESLAEARQARDLAAVHRMAKGIDERYGAVQADLTAGFGSGAPLEALAAKVGELRFYRRFLDEVGAIEDELAA
jgi:molecular chaperone HscB